MNIKNSKTINQISNLLKEISPSSRLKILLAIGKEESCVCHLEATLGMRQAYLSQHLMALRQAGILKTNREGRFINYRLANPKILDLIINTANLLDVNLDDKHNNTSVKDQCFCPKCSKRFEDIFLPSI